MLNCSNITDSNLSANPNQVLVLDTLEIHNNRPHRSVLAGMHLADRDGPGLPRLVKVEYHFGWRSWVFSEEYSIQRATQYVRATMPNAIAAFEAAVGVELPDTRVIELGVGVYGSKSRLASENPFALENGSRYQVTCKTSGVRRFVVDVRNGRTLIRFLDSQGDAEPYETYAPAVVLSAEDWRSLTRLAS
ncbi:hypothetical protein [Burkholderia ubonensis]|uniref:hypothetical protein n=1 Tax=Burkholderia ubonensis TaxID=101571 RepID=UPI000751ABCC|nr:hypothetical protein [Burkholderia ubonensis]KVP17323.1 hypothetical protein WJ84_03580 [Burkholderia ubonensis]KVP39557.1 hypothetical protein WJ87_04790 [Burkholderia ubonensis]